MLQRSLRSSHEVPISRRAGRRAGWRAGWRAGRRAGGQAGPAADEGFHMNNRKNLQSSAMLDEEANSQCYGGQRSSDESRTHNEETSMPF